MARESTIGSKFYLEDLTGTPATPGSITAVTKGATTTISTTETLVAGDVVRISDTGWSSLDRTTVHRVSGVGTGTVTIDTDTSHETAAAPSSGKIVKVKEIEICFAEFGLDTPTPNEVDVTTMCDTERQNVPGLANTGSATFGGPLDLTEKGVQALIAARDDAKPRSLRWITRMGQTGLLYGVVSSFVGAPQGVEQAVTFSGTFQVQGKPLYLAPLVVAAPAVVP
jgi:hypothetical protein